MPDSRIVVRGGQIVSMDPTVGILPRADLILVGGPAISQHPLLDPVGTLVFVLGCSKIG
ncbi:hypothetical protein [Mycobacterium asiaticum]|uniref:hypothetical protein n=1 Tax=Mycobacterium asiaticum TaxID=1790 RepID=UPI000AB93885|nr:hypothetical protein [Mycobacterium asiaticum]